MTGTHQRIGHRGHDVSRAASALSIIREEIEQLPIRAVRLNQALHRILHEDRAKAAP